MRKRYGIHLVNQRVRPKRYAFYDFIKHKLTDEILEDLHYQFAYKKRPDYLGSIVY